MKKRIFAILLALVLIAQLSPMPVARAEGETCTCQSECSTQECAVCALDAAQCALNATEPTETSEPTEPTETSEPTEPAETSEPTEPTETSEPTEPTETSEPTAPTCTHGNDPEACATCAAEAQRIAALAELGELIAELPTPETVEAMNEAERESFHNDRLVPVLTYATENGVYDDLCADLTWNAIADAMASALPIPEGPAVNIGNTVYSSLSEAVAAANSGDTITLADGNHTFPDVNMRNKSITFTGSKNAIMNATDVEANYMQILTGATLTFDGITVNWAARNEGYQGLANATKVIYKNCDISGTQFMYGDADFISCALTSTNGYCVYGRGAGTLNFTDCTFTTGGRAVMLYNDDAVTITANLTNCTFSGNGTDKTDKAAVEAGEAACGNSTFTINFTKCSVTSGFVANKSTSPLYGNKNSMDWKHLKVTIDGKDVSSPKVTATVGGATLNDQPATEIVKAAEDMTAPAITMTGTTIEGVLAEAIKESNAPIKVEVRDTATGSSVTFDKAAVNDIAAAEATVTLKIQPTTVTAAPEGATVYDITLTAPNDQKVVFAKGQAQVVLPVPDGKDTENLRVYYYGNNTKKDMNATFDGSQAIFTTNHFSLYSIEETDNTLWYYGDPSATEFTITTAEELRVFAELVNSGISFAGKTVTLANDIDLENEPWTPIGVTSSTPFSGTFNGNGKTISNLTINSTSACTGLFGNVINGTLTDITVTNATVTSNQNYTAAVVGYIKASTVDNCDVNGTVSVTGTYRVAAVVGKSEGINPDVGGPLNVITNCDVSGNASILGGWDVGGVIGYATLTNISGCTMNGGSVTVSESIYSGAQYAGGILGHDAEGITIKNCTVTGTALSATNFVGGISAISQSSLISGCTANDVTLTVASGKQGIGSIAGANNGLSRLYNNTTNSTVPQLASVNTSNAENPSAFVGTNVTLDSKNKVTGGTFTVYDTTKESAILPTGYYSELNADGTYTVKPIVYDITYKDGEASLSLTPATYTIAEAVTLPIPTKTGYKFDGWYASADLSGSAVTEIALGSTGAKFFYAKFTQCVAAIGSTGYTSLQEAIDAANSGDTVTLLENIAFGENGRVVVGSGSSLTIDLNGKTISGNRPAIQNNGTLTLKDSVGTGSISTDGQSGALENSGSLTILSGTYSGNKGLENKANATATIQGGTVSRIYNYGTLEISDGTVAGVESLSGAATISGGDITGTLYKVSGSISVTGGTFTYDPTNYVHPGYQVTQADSKYGISVKTFTIIYMDGGTPITNLTPTTYTVETPTFTLPTPTKTDFAFDGWTSDTVTTPTKDLTITKGTTGDLTFTANWKEKAATTLTLEVDKNNPTYGDTVTLTATLSSGTDTLNSQTVRFLNDGTLLSDVTVTNGVATFQHATLNAGVHTITAKFTGSVDYQAAQDATVTVTVAKKALTATYESQSFVVNGRGLKPSATVTVTGFVNGDTAATAVNYHAPTVSFTDIDFTEVRTHTLAPIGGTAMNYTFDHVSGTLTVSAPVITAGNEQTVTQGSTAEFRSNAAFGDLAWVEVDGMKLQAAYYSSWSGSTYVRLHADYVKTLAPGKHTLSIVSKVGSEYYSADTTFTVVQLTSGGSSSSSGSSGSNTVYDSDSPKTGDITNTGMYLALALIGMAGILAVLLTKKLTRKRR